MNRKVKKVAILITDGIPSFNGDDAYHGAMDAANDGIEIFVFGKSKVIPVIIIIIIVLPPGVVCPSNHALSMPGTADSDTVSRYLVMGRAGSVHHGTDQ